MFDSKTVADMRSILDEVCSHLPESSTEARTFVASRILECAKQGETTHAALLAAGRRAVLDRFASLEGLAKRMR
jgi:hypothetical protein